MLPEFLIEETTVREAGTGPAVDLGEDRVETLILTFGITRIIEQESIDLSIQGSADGKEWGAKPIAVFPQKFYCGTYQILVDLSDHPEARYLRAKWGVNRWGKGEPKPLFTIYVFAQAMRAQAAALSA
ncbi:MAG TPA: hypothetical protein VMH28_23765 [Candidatus Acidoferrales bacterium]|nr:hypothetical protein [Candidatus Acidoferrales bacterium]